MNSDKPSNVKAALFHQGEACTVTTSSHFTIAMAQESKGETYRQDIVQQDNRPLPSIYLNCSRKFVTERMGSEVYKNTRITTIWALTYESN